jgi:hypothetical protein
MRHLAQASSTSDQRGADALSEVGCAGVHPAHPLCVGRVQENVIRGGLHGVGLDANIFRKLL